MINIAERLQSQAGPCRVHTILGMGDPLHAGIVDFHAESLEETVRARSKENDGFACSREVDHVTSWAARGGGLCVTRAAQHGNSTSSRSPSAITGHPGVPSATT